MAVVKMQLLSVTGLKKNRKAVLETLQSLGIMEVTTDFIDDEGLKKMETDGQRTTFLKRAESMDEALKILKTYVPEKTGLLDSFAGRKVLNVREYQNFVGQRGLAIEAARNIGKLEREITECKGTLLKDRNQIESLKPWVNLDVPMDFAGTKTTGVLIGTVPGTRTEEEIYAAVYTAFAVEKAKLAEAEKTGNAQNPPEAAFAEAEGKAAGKTGATKTGNAAKATERTQNASFANAEHPVSVEMLFSENDSTGICVLFLKRDAETVAEGLRKIGFARPSQPESAVPAEQISLLEADMEKTEGKIAELTEEIGKYAGERERLRAVSDYYRTRAEKYKFLGTIPQSGEVFFFEGWVPEPQAERVQKLLTEKYDAIVEVEDPPEGMVTPTLLKNNKFSASVEGVLESYGLPQKGRVDPTFVMSIFYVFFFGMMLSDAGYGLVMSFACGIILLKY